MIKLGRYRDKGLSFDSAQKMASHWAESKCYQHWNSRLTNRRTS